MTLIVYFIELHEKEFENCVWKMSAVLSWHHSPDKRNPFSIEIDLMSTWLWAIFRRQVENHHALLVPNIFNRHNN